MNQCTHKCISCIYMYIKMVKTHARMFSATTIFVFCIIFFSFYLTVLRSGCKRKCGLFTIWYTHTIFILLDSVMHRIEIGGAVAVAWCYCLYCCCYCCCIYNPATVNKLRKRQIHSNNFETKWICSINEIAKFIGRTRGAATHIQQLTLIICEITNSVCNTYAMNIFG